MTHSSAIRLAHGHGGLLSQSLLDDIIFKYFEPSIDIASEDAAILPWNADNLVFTTDSFVVQPVFFPGGDIGKLAVCGTVNDLAMMGAIPKYISVSLILEEGFLIEALTHIVKSIQQISEAVSVKIVTGDTKVVPKGQADGIYINTAGIGKLVRHGISVKNAIPEDIIIISGPIGLHGMAIALAREDMGLESKILSDVAPLSVMIADVIENCDNIHVMRDITRGGLATILNEIAVQSNVGIYIDENCLPVPENVKTASKILGLDPLYLSNEGACVIILPEYSHEKVLKIMSKYPHGKNAKTIGKITRAHTNHVVLNTAIGSHRLLSQLSGEMLPRIC